MGCCYSSHVVFIRSLYINTMFFISLYYRCVCLQYSYKECSFVCMGGERLFTSLIVLPHLSHILFNVTSLIVLPHLSHILFNVTSLIVLPHLSHILFNVTSFFLSVDQVLYRAICEDLVQCPTISFNLYPMLNVFAEN